MELTAVIEALAQTTLPRVAVPGRQYVLRHHQMDPRLEAQGLDHSGQTTGEECRPLSDWTPLVHGGIHQIVLELLKGHASATNGSARRRMANRSVLTNT
jgi:hypothetical protein